VFASTMMELQKELLALRIADWYDKVISFQWFFLVVLLILPWFLWWRVVDRKQIAEIFSYGLLISLISSLFNGNGLNLILYSYPYKLLPFSPRAYSFSLTVLPVAYMLLYQYFTTRRSFAIACVVFSAVTAFVIQPILAWMDIYKLIKWNYFYSFLVLLFIGLMARLIHNYVINKSFIAGKNINDV